MQTAAPLKFGKYEVVGVLGKGAMGVVYDCRDPVIGRRVAIKTVAKEALDSSEAEGLLGRFKQEAQAAGRLNHPGVVSIYDYGENEDVAFIAMEYISGKELKKYFDTGEKFSLERIVRIMSEILEALEHAHRNKVVHRDIKPANIMITDDERVKVADFGVAKIESSLATQIGTRVGTPAYMAPEQHRMQAVDGRSDLFSCGVILYQFLTGARPFTGGSQTIARSILTHTPTPPSEINVELTPVWDLIVRKALAKRPDERYQSGREFIDALRSGLGGVPGASGGPMQSLAADAPANTPPDAPVTSSKAAVSTNSGKPERTDIAMESELEFWKEIKDSDHPDDFAAFIDSFPDGRFSHLARRRLDKLKAVSGPGQQDDTLLSAARAAPAAESVQREADTLARQKAEALEVEARQREQAESQARRESQERAEHEARLREQQEAEARKQQALQREAARVAAEKARQQEMEKAERAVEAQRQREHEAKLRQAAEEKARKEAVALKEAEARHAAEEKARKEAEARKRAEEDERQRERETYARQQAELKLRLAAEAKAKQEEEERLRQEREREAKELAQKAAQVKRAADEQAKAARAALKAAEVAKRGTAVPESDATIIRAPDSASAAAALQDADATGVRKRETVVAFDPEATVIRDAVALRQAVAKLGIGANQTDKAQTAGLNTGTGVSASPAAGATIGPADVDIDLTDISPHVPVNVGAPAAGIVRGVAQVPLKPRAGRQVAANDDELSQPAPEGGKRPVLLVAGVALALAGGAAWFALSPSPAPVSGTAEPAGAKSAMNQESRIAPSQSKGAAAARPTDEKPAAVAPAGPDTGETAKAQKVKEAEDQQKAAERDAQSQAADKAAVKAAAEKGLADKLSADKLAAAKSAADKVATIKSATEKAVSEKTAADKVATDRAAADKAAADKAAADKAATDRAVADKVAADRAAADKAAADKAIADRAAADKAATDRAAAANAAAGSANSIADRIAAATSPAELYKRAVALRGDGKAAQAVALLRQASSQGHGPSSRLLAVIYKEGAADVRPNFREVEKFQALAESQGDR